MTRSKSAVQINLVFAGLLVSLFRFALPNSGWCQDGFLEAPLENKIYHAEMLSAAISPDGKLVVTYGSTKLTTNPRELVVWDVATGRRLRSIPELRRTQALAISPDGRTLAAGGGQHQQLSGLRLFD
jgi:WD40 repeat protein